MKYPFIAFFLSLVFVSCVKQEASLSIDNKEMAKIVADLHIAEEMIGKFRKEEKDSVRIHYMNDISTIHKIDTSVIYHNLEIMQNNPRVGIKVYTEAYNILNEAADKANEAK